LWTSRRRTLTRKSFIIDPTVRFETIKEAEKSVQRDKEEFKHCFKNLSKHPRSMATTDSRSSVCGWGEWNCEKAAGDIIQALWLEHEGISASGSSRCAIWLHMIHCTSQLCLITL